MKKLKSAVAITTVAIVTMFGVVAFIASPTYAEEEGGGGVFLVASEMVLTLQIQRANSQQIWMVQMA